MRRSAAVPQARLREPCTDPTDTHDAERRRTQIPFASQRRERVVCAATPIGPLAKPRPPQARGPRGDRTPRGPCSALRRVRRMRRARACRKAPSASATPCPPAAWRCSTLGEGGLNCRVRDGTGSIPASVVALAGGAPPRLMDIEPARAPLPGRPWRPCSEGSYSRVDASQNPLRGCEELGLSAALG